MLNRDSLPTLSSTGVAGGSDDLALPTCRHCGGPVVIAAGGGDFCCAGCAAAYALVCDLGLDSYYRRRALDPDLPLPKPDDAEPVVDYAACVRKEADGTHSMTLAVEGLHCAACVWLIESVLMRQGGVISARLNMTTHRLQVCWRSGETTADALALLVNRLGYTAMPFDPQLLGQAQAARERRLLRAMAVAGFAFANVMLLSVSVWAGQWQGMGPATRDLLHWFSALIALPAIAYAGLPFFRSAAGVLSRRRTNMDVPISIGVLLASGMSLAETIRGGEHVYFDAAVGLLFFLLIGRYLESRARGRARSAAAHMLALAGRAVTILAADGTTRVLPASQVTVGMQALIAAGERIGVDGIVDDGASEIDTSLIDGESLPKPARSGTQVFAGTLNITAPLRIKVTAVGDATLLAEIARLLEVAEQAKSRFVGLADRIARYYAPVVHTAALLTFLGWWLIGGMAWQPALLIAISVLIITCPCALALAVPAVQVVATGRLMRQGILVKTGTALERLARVEMVVFDKTGTLTPGKLELIGGETIDPAAFAQAASLAAVSKHPLARALVRAAEARGIRALPVAGVLEIPGYGLQLDTPDGEIRLGSRTLCGLADDDAATDPELWLSQPPLEPVRFIFADPPREDAADVVAELEDRHYQVALMSGDREPAVERLAEEVGIDDWRHELTPERKVLQLRAMMINHDRKILMVGDGLNDAPALSAAFVSMSPASAVDLSQTAADIVFQGARLAPIIEALAVARRAAWLVRQNLAFALLYNTVTVPLAVAGHVTPLIAAIAMSGSSLVVTLNALRLNRGRVALGKVSWMSWSI